MTKILAALCFSLLCAIVPNTVMANTIDVTCIGYSTATGKLFMAKDLTLDTTLENSIVYDDSKNDIVYEVGAALFDSTKAQQPVYLVEVAIKSKSTGQRIASAKINQIDLIDKKFEVSLTLDSKNVAMLCGSR